MITLYKIDDLNHSFITQQYEVGVYGIIDNNPVLQMSFINKQEREVHIKLRKNIIKHKGTILTGSTFINYKGKININYEEL